MPTNALVTWFYPGANSGPEFVYSKATNQELARAKHRTVMATAGGGHQMSPTPDAHGMVVIGD